MMTVIVMVSIMRPTKVTAIVALVAMMMVTVMIMGYPPGPRLGMACSSKKDN